MSAVLFYLFLGYFSCMMAREAKAMTDAYYADYEKE